MEEIVDRRLLGDVAGVHWWAVVLRGVVAILFGLAVILWPLISLAVLIALFGAFALIDGVVAIIGAIKAAGTQRTWWPLLVVGILGIAAGVITFAYPGVTTLVLLYIISFWAILTGILQIAGAFQVSSIYGNSWLWMVSGALSIVFGILLLAYPGAGILSLVFLIGFFAIVNGLTLIALGIHLHGLERPMMRGVMQH